MSNYEEGYGAGYSDGLMSSTEIPSLFGTVLGEIGLIALIIKWFGTHYNRQTNDLEFDSPEAQEVWSRVKTTAKKVFGYLLEVAIIVVVFPMALMYYIVRKLIGTEGEAAKTKHLANPN